MLIPGELQELLSDAEDCGGKRVGGVQAARGVATRTWGRIAWMCITVKDYY